jgi:hypothetical protein
MSTNSLSKQKFLVVTSLICYSIIILKGDIIGIPFCLWLLLSLFNFGVADQVYSILAIASIIYTYLNYGKVRTKKLILLDFLGLLLLASPLIRRMTAVPIEIFNYCSFIIPTACFVLFYLLFLFFACKQLSSPAMRSERTSE